MPKYLDGTGLAELCSDIKTYFTGLLASYAPKNSPALTGSPTAPTPTSGDDSTKIATTAFVQTAVSGAAPTTIPDEEIEEYWEDLDPAEREQYLPLTGGTLTGVVNGVTPPQNDYSTKLATTKFVKDEIANSSTIPIGHEYFTMNPNIPQGSLPLFGGEHSRETYADLWAWVQLQTGYLKTEAEWQTLSTANNGNVPYYSDGDGSTTFRVPSLRCWVKAANGTVTEVGSYKAAGLPNITGKVRAYSEYNYNNSDFWNGGGVDGAFYWNANLETSEEGYPTTTNMASGTNDTIRNVRFDASHSNAIYGNSTTVQPESIVGMWLVKAYGTVEDTGTIDEQQYIDDRIAALPTSLATTFLPTAGGTMTGVLKFSAQGATKLQFNDSTMVKGETPSDYLYNTIEFNAAITDETDIAEHRLGAIESQISTSGSVDIWLRAYQNVAGSTTQCAVAPGIKADGSVKRFMSYTNNDVILGEANHKWKEVFAGTATINTSDERLKENITAIPDEVLDAWAEIGWYQFQFKESVAKKGENARIHAGAIAQRIKSVFEEHNIDAFRYGLLCYDEWDKEDAAYDKNGNIIYEGQEAGNQYSLRYEEALCMEAAYQRRRADRLEARIEALENAMKELG